MDSTTLLLVIAWAPGLLICSSIIPFNKTKVQRILSSFFCFCILFFVTYVFLLRAVAHLDEMRGGVLIDSIDWWSSLSLYVWVWFSLSCLWFGTKCQMFMIQWIDWIGGDGRVKKEKWLRVGAIFGLVTMKTGFWKDGPGLW